MTKAIKSVLVVIAVLALGLPSFSQETTQQQYKERYATLVKNLGTSGVGVETLLDRWISDYPDDPDPVEYKFIYYLAKCQNTQLVAKEGKTYLGEAPVLSLNDSLGNPVNYFQEAMFDDDIFAQAIKTIEGGIAQYPDRLDWRFYKTTALSMYEKESPDMTCSDLKSIIDYNFTQHPKWTYPDAEVDADFFDSGIQEYLVSFYRIASPASREAFREISLKMLDYEPNNVLFLDNVGSYFVAMNDHKTAYKYYNKVLKLKKDDLTAIRNCILIARRDKDVKNEKKYLQMMVDYADNDADRSSAKTRLEYYNKK
ncbi:MAG: hypothetical protein IJL91_00240 [Bacteroidales bacterium]|nr:hypothetical protein [Bacteroidales bacterium]